MDIQKKKDLLTGKLFLPKRINQKFANASNRIKYYNQKANRLRHSLSYINKPLHINSRILMELMQGKNEAIFHKQFLIGKGFAFYVHTHYNKFQGKTHFAIYQYTIITMEDDNIKIIRND